MNVFRLLLVFSVFFAIPKPTKADNKFSNLSLTERHRMAADYSLEGDFAAALPLLISIRDEIASVGDRESIPFLVAFEFEIGNCLGQLKRWEEARDTFKRCFLLTATEERKRDVLTAIGEMPKSPIER